MLPHTCFLRSHMIASCNQKLCDKEHFLFVSLSSSCQHPLRPGHILRRMVPRLSLPRELLELAGPLWRWLHFFSAAQQRLSGHACLLVMACRHRPNLLILGNFKRKLAIKMLSSDNKAVNLIWYITITCSGFWGESLGTRWRLGWLSSQPLEWWAVLLLPGHCWLLCGSWSSRASVPPTELLPSPHLCWVICLPRRRSLHCVGA